MRREERSSLEARLCASLRPPETPAPSALHAAVRAAAVSSGPRLSAAGFLACQVRFVRPRCWASFAVCLVLCGFVARAPANASATLVSLSGLGAALALCSLPEMVSARTDNMDELEGSCVFNAHAVFCARLVIFGCASALVCAVGVLLCTGAGPAWALLAHATAPYFASCAGGLLVARRVSSASAGMATLLWAALVGMLCAVAWTLEPGLYGQAASGVWVAAAVVAALWCAREVGCWLRATAEPAELTRLADAF